MYNMKKFYMYSKGNHNHVILCLAMMILFELSSLICFDVFSDIFQKDEILSSTTMLPLDIGCMIGYS